MPPEVKNCHKAMFRYFRRGDGREGEFAFLEILRRAAYMVGIPLRTCRL
jgi:hypothetical protein